MISIVICSVDPGRFRAAGAMYDRLLAGVDHEVIGVHDATGMCEGYNRGMARARGDLLVFSHDDIEILSADFADKLRRHLATYDVIGVIGTDRLSTGTWVASGPPHLFGQVANPMPDGRFGVMSWDRPARSVGGIQAMDGLFLAARRDAAERVGWDAETFRRFHLYDMDFTYRAYLAGHRLGVCSDIMVVHQSAGNFDDSWREDCARFERKFAGRLAPALPRQFNFPHVVVRSREQIVEVMTPGHWARQTTEAT